MRTNAKWEQQRSEETVDRIVNPHQHTGYGHLETRIFPMKRIDLDLNLI